MPRLDGSVELAREYVEALLQVGTVRDLEGRGDPLGGHAEHGARAGVPRARVERADGADGVAETLVGTAGQAGHPSTTRRRPSTKIHSSTPSRWSACSMDFPSARRRGLDRRGLRQERRQLCQRCRSAYHEQSDALVWEPSKPGRWAVCSSGAWPGTSSRWIVRRPSKRRGVARGRGQAGRSGAPSTDTGSQPWRNFAATFELGSLFHKNLGLGNFPRARQTATHTLEPTRPSSHRGSQGLDLDRARSQHRTNLRRQRWPAST